MRSTLLLTEAEQKLLATERPRQASHRNQLKIDALLQLGRGIPVETAALTLDLNPAELVLWVNVYQEEGLFTLLSQECRLQPPAAAEEEVLLLDLERRNRRQQDLLQRASNLAAQLRVSLGPGHSDLSRWLARLEENQAQQAEEAKASQKELKRLLSRFLR